MLLKSNSLLLQIKSCNLRKIFAGLLLMLFLFADSFNSGVFAAKKKSKSSRRSAGSSKKTKKAGKSSRRSASSSKRSSRRSASSSKRSSRRSASSSKRSSRRSAGSSRSSRRSLGSRSSRRRSLFGASARDMAAGAALTKGMTYEEKTDAVVETYGLEPCPLGAVLWLNPDEERDGVLYNSKKTACYSPENSEPNDWKKDSGITKAAWISDDEAIVLGCEAGFLKSIKDKKSVCVDESSFCPLNKQVVEKKGKTYINAATEEECNTPIGSSAVKVSKEELAKTGYEIKVGKAFYIHCKEGYYSKENGVECGKCPNFYTSTVGENIGEKSCKAVKDCEQEVGKGFIINSETGECIKSPELLRDEAIADCVKEGKGYNKQDGKCKPCGDLEGPDSNGDCQPLPADKQEIVRIAKCVEKSESYDPNSTKEDKCEPCKEGYKPNSVTGRCEETDEHKEQGCFAKSQIYNFSEKRCVDCFKVVAETEFKLEGKKGICVKAKEALRKEAVVACAGYGKAYAWDETNISKCGDYCVEGTEPKGGRCVETFERKREKAIENCKNAGLPYGGNDNDVSACGERCSSGYNIIFGKCVKSEQKQKLEKLEEKLKDAETNKKKNSYWVDVKIVRNNTSGLKGQLSKGIYKIELAGAQGGRGGGQAGCDTYDIAGDSNYSDRRSFGGKGEVKEYVILLDKGATYNLNIGTKGADKARNSVYSNKQAPSGGDGGDTSAQIGDIFYKVSGGSGGKGHYAYWYCKDRKIGVNGVDGGNGKNSGDGYVKIYKYKYILDWF